MDSRSSTLPHALPMAQAPKLISETGRLESIISSPGLNWRGDSLDCGHGSGRSVVRLARLLGVQEVGSSNLPAPTIFLIIKLHLRWPGSCLSQGMTSATHKFNRSGFTRTISVINLTGRMRLAAQFDFWRPGGLVCAMGDPDQMRSGVVDELNWSAGLLWQF